MLWGTEGGESWEVLDSGTTADLRAAWRGDNGAAVIVGDDGVVISNVGSGAFTHVELGTSNNARAVRINGRYGAIVGDELLFATSDGGETWGDQTLEGAQLRSIEPFDDGTMWAVGGFGLVVQRTDTWHLVDIGTTETLDLVGFVDADHGLIAGDGVLFATADAGQTWDPLPAPPERFTGLRGANFDDWVASGPSGTVWRSIDAGASWQALYESGVTGLGQLSIFEDNSMPNSQFAVAGSAGQVLVYGSRFVPDTGSDWAGCN